MRRTLSIWGLIELDSTQNGRLAAIFGFLLQHSVDDWWLWRRYTLYRWLSSL